VDEVRVPRATARASRWASVSTTKTVDGVATVTSDRSWNVPFSAAPDDVNEVPTAAGPLEHPGEQLELLVRRAIARPIEVVPEIGDRLEDFLRRSFAERRGLGPVAESTIRR
jgi:hypothetical protein